MVIRKLFYKCDLTDGYRSASDRYGTNYAVMQYMEYPHEPCGTRMHARRVLWATVSQYPEYYQVLQFGIKPGIRESTWYLTQNVPAKFRQDL